MTQDDYLSVRPSVRVEAHMLPTAVGRSLSTITGRESMSSGLAHPSARSRVPEGRPGRRGARQLADTRTRLSARDWLVLNQLARFRFLTTAQIEGLCFTTHATPGSAARICRAVLRRLAELRVIEHLERRIGGVRAGSQSFVWRVGVIGDRLLRSDDRTPRDRRHEPSARFLDHTLAAADAALQLTLAAREGRVELTRLDTEPATWRPYLGPSGAQLTLKPDLYAVTASGEFEDHWFIEIDRSTESLPTVVRQCQQYEAYRRSGRLQAEIEIFPWVVWLAPTAVRAQRLVEAIQGARQLDRSLYRVGVQGELVKLVTAESAP